MWALLAVGASGGLVPCPAALTALLAAVNLGRPAAGIAVVGAMSLGIAATLIAIGILFVQAGKVASKLFDSRGLAVYVPRASAVLITGLGAVLLARAFWNHGH
jgi:ABC-type nickel/cobalt efflux system permease component RcnA